MVLSIPSSLLGGGASGMLLAAARSLACGSLTAHAPGLLASLASQHVVYNPQRGLSTVSAPDPVALPLDFAEDKTVLVRLPERTWGPPARLTAAQVAAAALPEAGDGSKGKKKGVAASSSKIAVLRDPFASFDQVYRPLSQVVRPLGSSALAVHSDVNQPHLRVVVDEYVRDEEQGGYRLHSVATDLLTYLRGKQVPVALLPDLTAISPSATAVRAASSGVRQSSNEVLMVAPTAFGFNEQAAQDNSFMHAAAKPGEGSSLTRQVLKEFAALHHQLTEVAGVKVTLYEHSLPHGTPDACFPNNWFSTHPAEEAGGGVGESTLVLYPMKHPNRQAERRDDITRVLAARGYERVVDMSVHEQTTKTYFEGTGVLVLDRVNGVAYVDVSERADQQLAEEWVQRLGYGKLVAFRSTDLRGKSVYHTNVMMAIGTGVAIVCAESVADAKERQHLLSSLSKTHEVVQISLQQMDALCGNALELQSGKGLPVMAMSTQAYNAFTPDQRKAIERHVASIVHAPIDTLERVGGGGVRCTLAELF